MEILLTIIHYIVSILLILIVLLQAGRGGGMGAAFGGGGSQVFGGRGAASFLSKFTAGCAIVFFSTSFTLSWMSSRKESVVKVAQEKAAAVKAKKEEKAAKKATPATGESQETKTDTAVPADSSQGKEPAKEAPPAATDAEPKSNK